jgi:hypothetical protein
LLRRQQQYRPVAKIAGFKASSIDSISPARVHRPSSGSFALERWPGVNIGEAA